MWLHFKVTSLGVTPHLHQCQDFFLNKIPLKAAFNYEHNWAQLLLHPAQFWPTLIGFLSFLWFLSFRLQGFWLFGTEGSGLPLVRACMRCMCQSRRPSVGCRQGEANTFVCFFLCFRFGKNCWFFFALEERGFRLRPSLSFGAKHWEFIWEMPWTTRFFGGILGRDWREFYGFTIIPPRYGWDHVLGCFIEESAPPRIGHMWVGFIIHNCSPHGSFGDGLYVLN